MKKLITIFLFLLTSTCGLAQQFMQKYQMNLPVTLTQASTEWIDLDNDGLLDIMIISEDAGGLQSFSFMQGDTVLGPQFKNSTATGFTNASYLITDFNMDNQEDILVSGMFSGQPSTQVFINNGDFTFQTQSLINEAGSILKLVDLDQDGVRELIISGVKSAVPFFKIYKKSSTWQVVHDTLAVIATAIEVFDFDGDADNDLFISGELQDHSVYNTLLVNEGKFYFKLKSKLPRKINGKTSIGDLDGNGRFDIVLSGIDSIHNQVSIALLNNQDKILVNDLGVSLAKGIPVVADFNSNGNADISFYGYQNTDTINSIRDSQGSFLNIPHKNLVAQAYGDYDHDGDLDLVQVLKNSSFDIVVIENKTSKNLVPAPPFNAFAAHIFNRVLIYWWKPEDDRTVTPSLTYDLILQSQQADFMMGDFDEINKKRLKVSHGNQLTNNFTLLRKMPDGNYNYQIEAVDNSFHAGGDGICSGSVMNCNISTEVIAACKEEELSFPSKSEMVAFSFSKGFLGSGDNLSVKALTSDTILFFPKQNATCPSVRSYIVELKQNYTKNTTLTQFVCEGSVIPMTTETNWPHVSWGSTVKGLNFSSNYSIQYPVTISNDTVKVNITTGTSCDIIRNTIFKISKPDLVVPSNYQILKGEHVQLNASGGVSYQWSPASTLDNSAVANPLASPLMTTEYTVVVTDSVGCTEQAKVLVVVEEGAFIPNLFTPNGDTHNDEIKIYGLTHASNFLFSIHNREGSLVYETKNLSEVTSQGWNGSLRGIQQPAGVYYWKIQGTTLSGKKLLLNGKSSGSLVLIR